MTPIGWLRSALSPTHRQTLPELLSRIPVTVTATGAATLLADLVTTGAAVPHAPDADHAAPTYTRRGTP